MLYKPKDPEHKYQMFDALLLEGKPYQICWVSMAHNPGELVLEPWTRGKQEWLRQIEKQKSRLKTSTV